MTGLGVGFWASAPLVVWGQAGSACNAACITQVNRGSSWECLIDILSSAPGPGWRKLIAINKFTIGFIVLP
eukprot:10161634-Ditylum_brightwellii.AAC.1